MSSHEAVNMVVEMDDSIPHIDPMCMKVMFPRDVPMELRDQVTWPKNPEHKRFREIEN